MEGAGPLEIERGVGPQRLAANPAGTPGHGLGGPAGEGQEQDPARIGTAEHQVGNAMRQRAGLAGTSTGDDQQRRPGCSRPTLGHAERGSRTLGRVQSVEVSGSFHRPSR